MPCPDALSRARGEETSPGRTPPPLVVISALLLAVGVAAIPTAILGLTGNPDLVTGDPSHPALTHGRCQQLLHMFAASSCGQALADHHLQEIIRNHLLIGWLGSLALAAWWILHVHRKTQPALLPVGFALTVCSTLLGAVAAFLLAFGIVDVAHGINSTGGVIGSGDLVATGATMMTAALLSLVALARQATRPARNLTAAATGVRQQDHWPRVPDITRDELAEATQRILDNLRPDAWTRQDGEDARRKLCLQTGRACCRRQGACKVCYRLSV